MKSFTRRHFLRLLPAAALCSCGEPAPPSGPRFPKVKFRVTSSTQFTADVVSVIGGEAVDSRSLLPPGVSPHGYTPAAVDIAKFDTSDIVFVHGLGLEHRWPVDLASLDRNGVRSFTVSDGIAPELILRPSGPGGPPDPHIWNDPDLAAHIATVVENGLKSALPKLADYFAPRAHMLRLRFQDTKDYAAGRLTGFKPTDKFLLTSHDTMQYFARSCGMEARALCPADGTVPSVLPEELKTWITSHAVRTLFREPGTDVLALRNLLKEQRVDPDHIIHTLALPKAGTLELIGVKTFDVTTAAGAHRYNSESILAALEVD